MYRFSILLFLFSVFTLHADEIRTISGKSITGKLLQLNETNLTLETEKGAEKSPLSQVLAIEFKKISPANRSESVTDVRLLDGTVLHCKSISYRLKDVEVTLFSDLKIQIPWSNIISVVREAQNQTIHKKWLELEKLVPKRDRIVILRDTDLNVLEGTLGDLEADKIPFKRDGTPPVSIVIDRLHGFIFYRNEIPTDSPICRVIDLDGNSLSAYKLNLENGVLKMKTTFGLNIEMKQDILAKLDFNLGKLTYLSDLEPSRVIERSGVGLIVRYKKDTNLDGEPILLDRGYGKGISMHAYTDLEYNLAGKFKELKGVFGIDSRIITDSQPLVTVYCDGEKRFSEVISPKGVRPVAINVKDVNTLRIVVSSRNFLDLHDHVTFAEARVVQE